MYARRAPGIRTLERRKAKSCGLEKPGMGIRQQG